MWCCDLIYTWLIDVLLLERIKTNMILYWDLSVCSLFASTNYKDDNLRFGIGFFFLFFLSLSFDLCTYPYIYSNRKSSQTYTSYEPMMRDKLPFKMCHRSTFVVEIAELPSQCLLFLFTKFWRYRQRYDRSVRIVEAISKFRQTHLSNSMRRTIR